MATDVDRHVGDGDAPQRVAAGPVGPLLDDAGAGGVRVEPGGGVTQGHAVWSTGGDHGEVGTVRGELDVAHVGPEDRGAGGAVALGGPVGDRGRRGGQVDEGDLLAVDAAHGEEVADDRQLGAVGAHVELLHPHAVDPGEGGPDVERGVDGAGGGVDGAEAGARNAVDRPQVTTEIDLVAVHLEIAHPAGGGGGEAGDPRAVGDVQLGDAVVVDPVDGGEVAAGEYGGAARCRAEGVDGAGERRDEAGVDQPGGPVIGEDAVPGEQHVAGDLAHLGERAAHEDAVADLGDGADLTVDHPRGEVDRIGGRDRALLDTHRLARRDADQRRQHREHQDERERSRAVENLSFSHKDTVNPPVQIT